MRTCHLLGRLTGSEGEVRLTGRFVAKRQPGRLARLPGTFARKVPVVKHLTEFTDNFAANAVDDWDIVGQFKLEFGGTKLEFDMKSCAACNVTGYRSGRTLVSPKVHCPELLAAIQRITWQAEESIAYFATQIDRKPSEPAELLSCHWMTAILCLGIGQEQKAFDAINTGKLVIQGNLGQIETGGDLYELGLQLVERLKTADYPRKAGSIADLLGEAPSERPK